MTNNSKKLTFNTKEEVVLVVTINNIIMDPLSMSFVLKNPNSIYKSFQYSTDDSATYYITFSPSTTFQPGTYSLGISLNETEIYTSFSIEILIQLQPVLSGFSVAGLTGDVSTLILRGSNLYPLSVYYNCVYSYIKDSSNDLSLLENIKFVVKFDLNLRIL